MIDTVIFGAGRSGEKFVYQYFGEINIKCFWDNRKSGELLGYQVKKPEAGKKYFIIVAVAEYLEIRKQLIGMGYHEFDDFIPTQIFKKKMAIAYGNCHMNTVKAYLECKKDFSSEVGFYPFPVIQKLKEMDLACKDILNHCTLFFHQAIRKDNAYGEEYSSEKMLQHLNKSCEVIAIPNLYKLPKYLFPQVGTIQGIKQGTFSPFLMDVNIVSWLRCGKSKEEIIRYISRGGVYPQTEIIGMWKEFLDKVYKREREWDIKIGDYILKNHKKKKLFCDLNHISSGTAKEIASRTLRYMGYQEDLSIELPVLDDEEIVVYRDVKDALDLEYDDGIIRRYSFGSVSLNCKEMDLEEYVDQLCRYTRFILGISRI